VPSVHVDQSNYHSDEVRTGPNVAFHVEQREVGVDPRAAQEAANRDGKVCARKFCAALCVCVCVYRCF
jgi:hypothetical protein